MKDFTCKITLAEARVLEKYHRMSLTAGAADVETATLHASRSHYWADLIDKPAQSTPSRDHRLHCYTHDADGALVRLDIPSDGEA